MSTVEYPDILVGDHVKLWFHNNSRIIRVNMVRVFTDSSGHPQGRVAGRYIATGRFANVPYTTGLVVVFRPLTNEEIFTTAEGLRRDWTTGCRICGARWGDESPTDRSRILDHRPDCRYVKTLADMPG